MPELLSNPWSTPIDNKMIEFKESSIDKPKRRDKSSILRLIRAARASLDDNYEAIKDMCCNH
jgi:hypothetical protein